MNRVKILAFFFSFMAIVSCSKDDCMSCSGTETITSFGVVVSQIDVDNVQQCDEELESILNNPVQTINVNYLGIQATQRTIWTCR